MADKRTIHEPPLAKTPESRQTKEGKPQQKKGSKKNDEGYQ